MGDARAGVKGSRREYFNRRASVGCHGIRPKKEYVVACQIRWRTQEETARAKQVIPIATFQKAVVNRKNTGIATGYVAIPRTAHKRRKTHRVSHLVKCYTKQIKFGTTRRAKSIVPIVTEIKRSRCVFCAWEGVGATCGVIIQQPVNEAIGTGEIQWTGRSKRTSAVGLRIFYDKINRPVVIYNRINVAEN